MPQIGQTVRRMRIVVPTALVLTTFGGGAVAWASPWPLAPAGNQAEAITRLFWFMMVLAGVVFLLVEGLLIYAALRFRRRAPLPVQDPPQIHGNTRLEIMWAAVPALILVGLFGISAQQLGQLNALPPPSANAMHIQVTGQQFQWTFAYPDEAPDQNGNPVQSTNDLRMPVNQPVVFEVTSKDVIHSFWIPELMGKVDANPGHTSTLSLTTDQIGQWRGACAELCGAGHAGMLFTVEAVSQSDFDQWIQQIQSGTLAGAGSSAGLSADAQAGMQLIESHPCGTCHTIPGISNATGQVGPNLAGVASRTTIAGGAVPNTGPADLAKWITNPPAVKPGTIMPVEVSDLSADQINQIVAYLETLK